MGLIRFSDTTNYGFFRLASHKSAYCQFVDVWGRKNAGRTRSVGDGAGDQRRHGGGRVLCRADVGRCHRNEAALGRLAFRPHEDRRVHQARPGQ